MENIENLQTELTNNLVEELVITEEHLKPIEDTNEEEVCIILDRGVYKDS